MLNIRLTLRNTPGKSPLGEAGRLQGHVSLMSVSGSKQPAELFSSAQGFRSSAFLMRGCLKPVETWLQRLPVYQPWCLLTHIHFFLAGFHERKSVCLMTYTMGGRAGCQGSQSQSFHVFMALHTYKMRSCFRKVLDNIPWPELTSQAGC